MTKIMKSSEFTPSAGVKHTDNIELTNSPSIDGGAFKSPKNVMSRAEFELRTSLTILKQMGPEKGSKRRNNKVTQSMEIKPYRQTGFSSAGKSFSNLTESRVGSAVRRLPKIKVFNKESIKDMFASLKDVEANKVIIDQAGPSPGAFTIAQTRRKLRQSPVNTISFKRVGIKQPVFDHGSSRRINMSIDFSEQTHSSFIGGADIEGQGDKMEGIQIVDPNNRYKHPKSKLHDSDMGILAQALGNDTSI